MTLSDVRFKSFSIDRHSDIYYDENPALRLDDLDSRYEGNIKLSLMISTYNRRSQLQRTLETLARQSFRAFEVLINNDGSTQDLKSIMDVFSRYLNIQYFESPRSEWRSCPSKAFKMMLPHTKGDVIAISHPEILIDYDGIEFLYDAVISPKKVQEISDHYVIDEYKYGVPVPGNNDGKYRWAILRNAFIPDDDYVQLDKIDWHSDLKNIQHMKGFWKWVGFGGKMNLQVVKEIVFPWWFVGATTKDCPIWDAMPEFRGHGIIDMWLCDWRRLNGVTDVITKKIMSYHQPHVTMAIAPVGESTDETKFAKKAEE